MLSGAWIFITVLLLLAAIVLNQAPLFIVAALFFLTSGVARLWSRYSLARLEFKRKLSAQKVFWGDHITLDISVSNTKMLPLPWIMVQEEVPRGVSFLKGKLSASHKNNREVLSNFLSLSWYHKLTRRYPVHCQKRGVFVFGPAAISSGDPFGFFRKKIVNEETDRLLVYPKILPLEDIGIPSRHPFGDLRIKRHLFQDPVLVMTTREYVQGDPLKYIHWKSTARLQRLQSRVFDYTTTIDMALFLDTRTAADTNFWSIISPDFLETAILTATSISNHAFNEGYKVGLYANEYYYQSEHLIKLAPSNNTEQFRNILEALAQLQGIPALTMDKLLNREARQLPWETTIVLITAVPTADLIATLKRFKKAGRRIALVVIGADHPAGNLEGINIYHVSEEVYRRQAESIRLGQK
ncbi:MAG TPA: DUF58 domain-containing protein [Dehalococcoidales bacterium]|nr:DUF58 domain-containing protein [Dehalococcoidales bacterium]